MSDYSQTNNPQTFEMFIESVKIDANNGVEPNWELYLNQLREIHKLGRNKFVRVMVVKRIEKVFAQQQKTMATRSQKEQDLLGAFLNVAEQNFKNEVKSLYNESDSK